MIRIAFRLIAFLVLVALEFSGVMYVRGEIYNFSEPEPFSGDYWWNPYETSSHNYVKCNFHAHSVAWGGVTNGHQSEEEMLAFYAKHGYTVAGISNYHKTTEFRNDSLIHIPVYEHGYNVTKTHKLSINPKEISYFDFPLFQGTSHKQGIVENLRDCEAIVAINHPMFVNGHTKEDFSFLTGYHLIEVLNHYRISDEYWDAALSSGKLGMILANDDTHDITGTHNTLVMWTRIDAKEKTKESILQALIEGRAYGVKGWGSEQDTDLKKISVRNDSLVVKLEGDVRLIRLIGQNGKIVKEASGVDSIKYALKETDTYVRVYVETGKNQLYFNPVVRYNGEEIPFVFTNRGEVNWWKTMIYKALVLGLMISTFIGWNKLRKRLKISKV